MKMTDKKLVYEKAVASVVYFDNSDVITTSYVCESHSNKAGIDCMYGQTAILSKPCWENGAFA